MNLVTNVTKQEYSFRVRRKRDGEEFTMLIEAESEAAARLLIPDTVELAEEKSENPHRHKFFKKGVDFSSRMNYTKCVTEREVKQCHHAQADQRLKIPRMCASASGLMRKQTVCLTSIVKRKKSTKRKPSGRECSCFWRKKNKCLASTLPQAKRNTYPTQGVALVLNLSYHMGYAPVKQKCR